MYIRRHDLGNCLWLRIHLWGLWIYIETLPSWCWDMFLWTKLLDGLNRQIRPHHGNPWRQQSQIVPRWSNLSYSCDIRRISAKSQSIRLLYQLNLISVGTLSRSLCVLHSTHPTGTPWVDKTKAPDVIRMCSHCGDCGWISAAARLYQPWLRPGPSKHY